MNNRKLLAILLTILTVLIGVIFVLTLLLRFNNEQPISDNNDALLGINQSKITLGGADPVTMDPHIAGDGSSATYIVEIFGGLVTITPDMEIVLDLAQSLEVSDDGLVYTFTLRDDIYFHSGRKVTANDVKWSLERAASPQLNSNTSLSYLRDIVGFIERRYGQADEISGVEVIDDKTISIEIDFPKSYFLAKLTYPTAFVIDKDQVELNPRNWTRKPNGTGPYKLSEWKLGERIILEANTRYHLGVGNVQVVDYQLSGGSILTRFENGAVDSAGISQNDIDRVRDPSEPLNKLYRQSNISTYMYGNNMVNKSVTDLMQEHRFVRQVEHNEISEFDTFPMLEGLAKLQLGPAHIDLGKMVVKFQNTKGDGRTLDEFLVDELGDIIGSDIKPLPEPQDVVLYGFGRIGRLIARILVDKAGGGDVLRLRAIVIRKGKVNHDLEKRAALLRRDSVHGPFKGTIRVLEDQNTLVVNGNPIKIIYYYF